MPITLPTTIRGTSTSGHMTQTTRTITRDEPTLHITDREPVTITFFSDERSKVKFTIPSTWRWKMGLHWHLRPERDELITMLEGGWWELFEAISPYGHSIAIVALSQPVRIDLCIVATPIGTF
jgi:hypothetical protein